MSLSWRCARHQSCDEGSRLDQRASIRREAAPLPHSGFRQAYRGPSMLMRTLLLLGENQWVMMTICPLQVFASWLWKAREEGSGQEEVEEEEGVGEGGRRWELAMLLRQTATLLGMCQFMEPVMQCPPMLLEMTL